MRRPEKTLTLTLLLAIGRYILGSWTWTPFERSYSVYPDQLIMFHLGVRLFCRGSRRLVGSTAGPRSLMTGSSSLLSPSVAGVARLPGLRQTSSSQPSGDTHPTNGPYLDYSMLYFDSIAFLLSNQLGIPAHVGGDGNSGKTPAQVAARFNLSLRGASALLVTLCRMNVVQIQEDSDESGGFGCLATCQ